jgi:hypothetical protein
MTHSKATFSGLAFAAALLGVAACSAPSAAPREHLASVEQPIQTVSVPLPVGTWTRATNIEHYHLFAAQDDAVTWFTDFEKRRAALEGRTPDAVVPHSDARYAPFEAEAAKVWDAYKQLFPRDTAGLDAPPRIVLIQRDDVNAYAVFDPELTCTTGGPAGCAPHAFMVHTASLEPITDPTARGDALFGLVAHELAHHVLKHTWPGVGDKVTKYFDASHWPAFGFEQLDDAATRARVEGWLAPAGRSGPFPLTQLHGMPWVTQSFLDLTRRFMTAKAAATNAAACDTARATYRTLANFLDDHVDEADQALDLTSADDARLDGLAANAVHDVDACVSVLTTKFTALVAEEFGVAEADVSGSLTPAEHAVVDAAATPFDALVGLGKLDYAAMAAIDVKSARSYTFEEQADDVGINVLFRAGMDARSLATFFRFRALTAMSREACEARVGTATEPPFGLLSDPHHATCWRIDHADRLVTFMSQP